MKYKILFLICMLGASSILHSQESTLPINPDTKLVSISKVVDLFGMSKSEIYARINDWYLLKLNSIKDIKTTKKNDKDGIPQLVQIQYFNFDPNNLDSLAKNRQKLMFKTTTAQLKHGIGLLGPKSASGYEYATLIILIKDSKLKYEFTEFIHQVAGDISIVSAPNIGELWKYEREDVLLTKKSWNKLRIESLNKHRKLAEEFIEYIKNPSLTNMDF